MLRLRPFRQRQLPLTDRWFADADTQRWLGGPGWPGLILDLHKRPLGEYRGAVETGRYSWLAWDGDTAVGYVGCDTYDRCTTWDGSPDGRGVVKTLPVPTANLSYVVDPALRRQGYGTSIIAALMASSQITHVSLFVAGVEPANTGSISCLLKNGFQPLDPAPDWEGTVYYARERPAASAESFVLAVATLRVSVRAVFAAMFHGPDRSADCASVAASSSAETPAVSAAPIFWKISRACRSMSAASSVWPAARAARRAPITPHRQRRAWHPILRLRAHT